MKIAICRKIVNKSKDFETLATSFENLELTQAQLASEINKGYAFTTWHKGRRQQNNFECGQHIGLDFDKAQPGDVERLAEDNFTKNYCGIVYYTPSSTDDNPRFRLVFELDQPIFDGGYYRDAVQALIWSYGELGATADKSCTDPTRFFYGSKDSQPSFTDNILPSAELAKIIKAWRNNQKNTPRPAPEQNGVTTPASATGKVNYLKKVLETTSERIRNTPHGDRHNALIRAARLLGGYLQGEPEILSEFEAYNTLENAYSSHSNFDPKEMQKAIRAGFEYGRRDPLTVPPFRGFSRADFDNTWSTIPDVDPETGEVKSYTIFNFTDVGNGKRLIERFGKDLHYVKQWGWLVWNGSFWEMDECDRARQLAKQTVRTIYQEAAQVEDADQRIKIAKWATASESMGKITAMLEAVFDETPVRVTPAVFDTDLMLLNVKNGTIDLRTGELRPHNRADRITKTANVEYDPKADCPTWLTFLYQVMGENAELVKFLQRAVGYSLTGDTSEHRFFLCYGTGSNGKSTFMETLRYLLGSYAQTTNFDTFLERQGEGPRNDIAKLVGTRFVAASEPDIGKNISESIIKQLTGGDVISARLLYKENFEFKPSFKIFLSANHKPNIRGQDNGMWRRVTLIPFDVTIDAEKRDRRLPDKLRAELPGILNWAIQGCLDWQKNGLGEPDAIREATASYKDESDRLRDFLTECCSTKGRGAAMKNVEFKVLFKAYNAYCEDAGERALGKNAFIQSLTERGFLIKPGTANKRFVWGITLLDERNEKTVTESEGQFFGN